MADAVISRLPPVIDLELYAGDGVAIRFTVTDEETTPFPLDGEFLSQIKTKRSDTEPLLTWGIDKTDISTGIVILSLTGEQTASLVTDRRFQGVWDLQYTATGGEPQTLVQGKVTCDVDVTH